ncbi:hypothetical protein GDO81_025560 [Engystomops pustulosus]|uniref:Uncharacterized protein n=1 Tax=Engystomops pustulosus TaxID=76066 RepID=A0AAV6Z6Y6_ENGPU|nr:hypothetical protein GDO81_025560 [Engystomops pustulosus]
MEGRARHAVVLGQHNETEQLLDQCLAPDTSGDGTGCDNMTCIIVRFHPSQHSSAEANKRKLDVTENCSDCSKKAKTD